MTFLFRDKLQELLDWLTEVTGDGKDLDIPVARHVSNPMDKEPRNNANKRRKIKDR